MTYYVVRPVTEADALVLQAWRNDPETLRWVRHQEPVSWDSHVRWLRAALCDDRRLYRVVAYEETPIASVRYDRLDGGNHTVEVSIVVAAEFRGRGVGSVALELGERDLRSTWPDVGNIMAVVHADNVASRRLFENDGYRAQRENQPWVTLAKTLDSTPTEARSPVPAHRAAREGSHSEGGTA